MTVARPVEREVVEWDEYTGRLEAVETVEVRARVSGFIQEAPFEEGSLVKQGDLLFVIDPRPFQAEVARAEAEVARAEAQRAFAANDYKRLEDLRPQGGASELELENARQTLRENEAGVAAEQAALQTAKLNLEWTRVTAPIAGRISRKNVTPGNLINGGPGSATLLTTITSIDPIYAYIDVDEASVLKYQQLSKENKRTSARESQIPVFLGLSNEDAFPHEGVIDFVDNRVDPDTGTLRARGVFANPGSYLTPGLFARLRIPGSGRYAALLIPDLAIGTDQDQRFVLLVNGEGSVERRPVQLGAAFGRFRAVERGVTANDRVIINGLQRARPSAKVNAQESPIDPSTIPMTAAGSATTQALPATRQVPATRPTGPAPAPATTQTSTPATIGASL